MSSVITRPKNRVARSVETLADLVKGLGGVPLYRIRFRPIPGTATVADAVRLQEKLGIPCELIDGVLVEKAVGYDESTLGMFIGEQLNRHVRPENLGLVSGESGMMEILADLIRIPDVAFVRWDRFPGRRRPKKPVPRVAPNLVVEVLSKSNTRAEMKRKRRECFEAGVELFWEVDPKKRIVRVYTAAEEFTTLTEDDSLDGGAVLPGFRLSLRELFAELDRHG